MGQRLRLSAIAGLCGLLLRVPIIFLDYSFVPGVLARANPQLAELAFWIYALSGFAFICFLWGFANLGYTRNDAALRLTSYLLIVAYGITQILGIAIFYNPIIYIAFGPLVNAPLILVRATLTILLGVAILRSQNNDGLNTWAAVCAALTGIAVLSQLTRVSLDDIASVPFLITGALLLMRASEN